MALIWYRFGFALSLQTSTSAFFLTLCWLQSKNRCLLSCLLDFLSFPLLIQPCCWWMKENLFVLYTVSMQPARFNDSDLEPSWWRFTSIIDGYTKPSLARSAYFITPAFQLGKSTTEPVCLSLSLRAEHRPGKHKDRRSKHEDLHFCRSEPQLADALLLHLGCLEGKTDQGRIDDGVAEHRMHMIFDGI